MKYWAAHLLLLVIFHKGNCRIYIAVSIVSHMLCLFKSPHFVLHSTELPLHLLYSAWRPKCAATNGIISAIVISLHVYLYIQYIYTHCSPNLVMVTSPQSCHVPCVTLSASRNAPPGPKNQFEFPFFPGCAAVILLRCILWWNIKKRY